MIVVVTGSRSFDQRDPELSKQLRMDFIYTIESFDPDHVFHGGAAGPDVWAKRAFPLIETEFNPIFRQQTRNEIRNALHARNMYMLNTAVREDSVVQVVACWDGKSGGTRQAMLYAASMDLPIVSMTGEVPCQD